MVLLILTQEWREIVKRTIYNKQRPHNKALQSETLLLAALTAMCR